MFNNSYYGKRVLVTGHTGFKGSWLTMWLLDMGAEVHGFSDNIPSSPSAYEVLGLESKITETRGDIADTKLLKSCIDSFKPDFVFHLAAQALVSLSYKDPVNTIQTNVMGVANVLEAARSLTHKCTVIVITSDKCYENVEWEWGYKETDHLGGKDIYSGSKGAAEAVFHAYYHSFFIDHEFVSIASARAGNVIGGGDWALDRIVADCVRSWSSKDIVKVRSPEATRPWQHVLEPLSGYLSLAAHLDDNKILNGESYNFGPNPEKNNKVLDVIELLSNFWKPEKPLIKYYEVTDNIPFHEAGLLKLNCDKALYRLSWEPTLNFNECIDFVGNWYNKFYNESNTDMYQFTLEQIRSYCAFSKKRNIDWS